MFIRCRTPLQTSQDDAVFSLHGGAGQKLHGQDKGNNNRRKHCVFNM